MQHVLSQKKAQFWSPNPSSVSYDPVSFDTLLEQPSPLFLPGNNDTYLTEQYGE